MYVAYARDSLNKDEARIRITGQPSESRQAVTIIALARELKSRIRVLSLAAMIIGTMNDGLRFRVSRTDYDGSTKWMHLYMKDRTDKKLHKEMSAKDSRNICVVITRCYTDSANTGSPTREIHTAIEMHRRYLLFFLLFVPLLNRNRSLQRVASMCVCDESETEL